MTAKAKQDIHYSEDTRLALLEQSIGHINETLMRFEKRFDQVLILTGYLFIRFWMR